MQKIILIFLFYSIFFIDLSALNDKHIIQQIKSKYDSLDSISYIEKMKLSFLESINEELKETENLLLEFNFSNIDYENLNPKLRKELLDSIQEKYPNFNTKNIIKERYDNFSNSLYESNKSVFVLNIILEKNSLLVGNKYNISIDKSNLPFNIYLFKKNIYPDFYVYVTNGMYIESHVFYPTFSKGTAKNIKKAFKKVLSENPDYLLNCNQIDRYDSSILYVLNNGIYIYRVKDFKKYELNEYLNKFYNLFDENL